MSERNQRTVRDLRRGSRSAVLRRLYFEGPLSRQELGPATGLSSGSITNVVGELLADGLVEEAGSVGSDGGRPRTLLRVAPRSGCLVGVDVGETRIRVGLFDLTLREISRTDRPLDVPGRPRGPGHDVGLIVQLILDGLSTVLGDVPAHAGAVLGVGIGVPGIVEYGTADYGSAEYRTAEERSAELRAGIPLARDGGRTAGSSRDSGPVRDGDLVRNPGLVRGPDPVRSLGPVRNPGPGPVRESGYAPPGAVVHGQTIGWDAVPLEALLRRSTDLPLHIDNGAKTLGQAELWFGAGRGARNAVIALLGSGVGACVVMDGSPLAGATSGAGEWGHTTLQVGGRRCRCGARGCLEAYAGAAAILDRWREAGGGPPGGYGGHTEESALAELLAAADADDLTAVRLLEETAEYLGAGIADLVNLFNPERIVLGGWAGLLLGPRLLPDVRAAAAAYALRHPYERAAIELGRAGPDAVTMGAATLPLARLLATGGSPRGPIVGASG
ncbi:ROK family transcriptional regulator [Streptomyces sp. NPDC050617]|uniref:ROK family transcriptional regulator n=1 Tax=Streptomyces sp. NPDC050617 TaxID=3154628 RepID=UPI003441941C